MYKFVVTTNGLEIYNYNWKKFNLYPSLIGLSNENNNTQVSITTLNNFAYFELTDTNINGYDKNHELILQNY